MPLNHNGKFMMCSGKLGSASSPEVLLFHLFQKRTSGDWWNCVF